MKKFLLFVGVAAATFMVESASAQVQVGKGQLSGSLESNNILYVTDEATANPLDDMQDPRLRNFGSHDYLKLDYTLDRFSAGIQIDGYLPGLYGYDIYRFKRNAIEDPKGKKLFGGFLTKYIQWEDTNYGIRVGDIYDQFGNGLIFRAYEERALGFNNSVAGARVHYNLKNYFNIKVLAGSPRLYDERAGNWVFGGDLSLSISDMAGWNDGMVSLEGSYVGRYQKDAQLVTLPSYGTLLADKGLDTNLLNMVSGRFNFEYAGFTLRSEYAAKLNNDIFNAASNAAKGNAIYLDLGYSYKRFSASATFRRQVNMTTMTKLDGKCLDQAIIHTINYLPMLTRQYTYSLANLNPYTGFKNDREAGGQIDLYYSLRNSKNRAKYWNFHLNASLFYQLKDELHPEAHLRWFDINFDVDRQWSRKLKTTFLYSRQQYDSNYFAYEDIYDPNTKKEPIYCVSNIFVADLTYKFNKKHSLRVELQYLWDATNLYYHFKDDEIAQSTFEDSMSDKEAKLFKQGKIDEATMIRKGKNRAYDNDGDWVAATIEYNFAPMFSFYVSDMWNITKSLGHYSVDGGNQGKLLHYYQVGASFTYDRYRVQLSYGRNRAGTVCSGGVCRYQPAYTGANLSFTASF